MPLLDHLGELRRRLTIIVVAVLITAVVVYAATPTIIDMLLDPIRAYIPDGKLSVLTALGGFTVRFKVSLFVGLIVASPIVIWQIMAFFLPALKPNERRWVVPTFAAFIILFLLGMIFCYLVILNAAFGWLYSQTVEFATVVPQAEDYISIIMLLEIGFGIAFQLPLVVFYLTIFHIVPYYTLRRSWRYVYVALMVISGITTPDASPVTMILMFAALVSLYEISLAIARQVISIREGKQALKWDREQYAAHSMDD